MAKTATPNAADQALAQHALAARKRALAPYSNFFVGAALRTQAGKIYVAGNIESSSYGLTVCAERVALFKALSEGERAFEAMAIAAATPEFCAPCGACRQVLWDYAPALEIILVNQDGEFEKMKLSDLIPNAFDSRFL